MDVAEIIFLCLLVAVAFFWVGYGIRYSIAENKCDHRFEEILNTITRDGKKDIVVYMCKKCGKRKITKV